MTVSLYALVMTFGALVAAAGLVLLFIRQEQGKNRIKILGQEFQISTPALVVFLAGFALVIMTPALQIKNQAVTVIPGTMDRSLMGSMLKSTARRRNPMMILLMPTRLLWEATSRA